MRHTTTRRAIRLAACLLASLPTLAAPDQPTLHYDVAVGGATPAGIAAAIAAARAGNSVGLFDPTAHIGGVVSGGLTATDYGDRRTIGGLAREFFDRVREHYKTAYGPNSPQARRCSDGFFFEPHLAEEILAEMLHSAGRVDVFLRHQLLAARVADGRITQIEMRNDAAGGQVLVTADVFIDALYEGDLMALAGVPYRVGREGAHEYGEPHAGARPGEPEPPGSPDLRVQAYNYRLCLTDDPNNRLPLARPPGYSRSDYRTVEAFLQATPTATFTGHCVSIVHMPNGKVDANCGVAWQSTDYVGANHEYAGQTTSARRKTAGDHHSYIRGLLYFLQTDPAVPQHIRDEAGQWGLARDEFADHGHWPHQLYVREARRMIGRHVFAEHDATASRFKDDSIGLGSYTIDSHAVRRMPQADGTYRGAGWLSVQVEPYEIPYRVLTPRDLRNLLVPVCCSATHVGYCTLRMEPVYTIMGQACGEAAALARETGAAVQEIDIARLQERLVTAGQIIRANRRPIADFRIVAEQPLPAGTPVEFEDASTDEDGRVTEWRWDFNGDGELDSTEAKGTFTFARTQEYEVTLFVRDDYGDFSHPCRQIVKVVGGPFGVPDIVIDNPEATLTGAWWPSASSTGFVGLGYLHDRNAEKGQLSARYVARVKTPGLYDVAISFTSHPNRASNVPVRTRHAGGETVEHVDQRTSPEGSSFRTLGRYRLTPAVQAVIEIGNTGTDGYVIADAVRLRYAEPQTEEEPSP
jgi:PKD repeat protein